MKSFTVFALVAMSVIPAMSQVPVVDAGSSPEITLESGFASKYVGKNSGTVYADSPVLQSGVNIDTGINHLEAFGGVGSMYLGIWNSSSLSRHDDNTSGDEVDILTGWAGEINGLNADCGISYYDFSEVGQGWSDNALALHWEVEGNLGYVLLEVVLPTGGSDFEGGTYTTVGKRFSLDLGSGVSLDSDFGLTRDDGVYGETPNWIVGLESGLKVTRGNLEVKVIDFQFTAPLDRGSDEIENQLVASFGFAYKL